MEYKYPHLPERRTGIAFDGVTDEDLFDSDQMLQYAEQAVTPLLAEIERLKRGEFICNKCYLRKDAEVGAPDF